MSGRDRLGPLADSGNCSASSLTNRRNVRVVRDAILIVNEAQDKRLVF